MELGPPVAALIVSLTALLLATLTIWQKADRGYVRQLESRIVLLERTVERCEGDRDRLLQENVQLMRQLVQVVR